ncbi:MAG TPA: hypothetical protein VFS36_08325 [Chitinophagaceae bacterium]|nr:hypothetical protein [Chitinophagaceae bacterium]
MHRLLFLPILFVIAMPGIGQKKMAVGFSFNFSDFQTPTEIKQTSLGDVIRSGHWGERSRLDPGFSVYYWRAVTKKIDVSGRYNALFGSNSLATLTNEPGNLATFFNELETSVHARMFYDNKIVNPFLSAGLGLGNYWKKFGVVGYLPVGAGLQFNIVNEAYIHLQVNNRISFNKNKLPNNLFYSLGISQIITRKKR